MKIEVLEEFFNGTPSVREVAEYVLSRDSFENINHTLITLHSFDADLVAVIELVKQVYPNARYGFDYSNNYKNEKTKEYEPARAWVKHNQNDVTISGTDIATCMLKSLLRVIIQEIKLNERNAKYQK